MTGVVAARECLNCGAALSGAFCAACGQRDIPPYPTVAEMAGDAWQEMSGWDGRLARTIRALLTRPGALTVETLAGRRARYVKPLRLYLSASLFYFVVAAAAPNLGPPRAAVLPGREQITINVMEPTSGLTAEQREAALAKIGKAPAIMRPIFLALLEDPAGVRTRVLAGLPKMAFALVPVAALILGVFHRRRRYMQHLTFALHTNAAFFLAIAVPQLTNFARSTAFSAVVAVAAAAFVVWYAIRAQQVVYGDGVFRTLVRSAGILLLYGLVAVPGLIAVVAWAAYFR